MNFFSAFLEMFRNSDQFIAHMSAEYGIYVYLFLFTVYFLETGIVICALLPGDSLIFVSGAASAAGFLGYSARCLFRKYRCIRNRLLSRQQDIRRLH